MNRRLWHAAALAVGWYLMRPPSVLKPSTSATDIPPLGRWHSLHSYASSEACENALAGFLERLKEDASKDPKMQWKVDLMGDAQCIASDDPRLKMKSTPR